MNDIKKDNTEEKILEAAKTVFMHKGMDGARMQEIADEAGINKALLHYYFRSKQKLFEAIVKDLFQQIFPNALLLVNSEKPIGQKLSDFIESYLDILLKNPFLPAFVIQEMNRDPQFLSSIFVNIGNAPNILITILDNEMEAGTIVKMDPKELIINILSLCLFPFASKPLMQLLLFENNAEAYNQFLEERKKTIKEFVLNAITIKQ